MALNIGRRAGMTAGPLQIGLSGGVVMGGGGWSPTFLLRDDFLTNRAAGAIGSTVAEPTGGTRTVIDTNSKMSITSEELVIATGGVGAGNPGLWYPQLTRLVGRAVGGKLLFSANAIAIGLDIDQSSGLYDGFRLLSGFLYASVNGTLVLVGATSLLTTYQCVLVERSAGNLYFVKGGAWADWTLVFVGGSSTAALYPTVGAVAAASEAIVTTMRAADIPSLSDNYSIATDRIATTVESDTITSEADTVIEHTITALTGVTQELMVRRTDDDNCWIVRMDQAGSTIKLIQKQGGVETERSSTAQTWADSAQYRIQVQQYGLTIRVFVDIVAKGSYASASFNSTAMGVKVSHAGADLVAWPSVPGATVQSQLTQVFPNSTLALSFGYVSDIHYGDKNTALNRYYRDGDEKLAVAVEQFNKHDLSFVIVNGDLIDSGAAEDAPSDLSAVVNIVADLDVPSYYSFGNHDLTDLSKAEAMAVTGQSAGYYSFNRNGYHFVVLDACYSADDDDAHYDTGNFDFTDTYVPPTERTWLAADLAAAVLPIIVLCHQRLDEVSNHAVVNAADVRAILESADVRAVFQGHAHANDKETINDITYYTMQAATESAYPATAFGVVRVYQSGAISVQGFSGQSSW